MMALIGDFPDAAEAALLQAYPGNDPVRDVLTGRISLRRFRVLVENLPPNNPLQRARGGPWAGSDQVALAYATESRLRELITLLLNLFRSKDEPGRDVEYLPRPLSAEEVELQRLQAEYDAEMVRQLEEL